MPNRAILLIEFANFDCAINKIKIERGLSPKLKVNYRKLIQLLTLGHNVIEKKIYLGTKKNSTSHKTFFDFFERIDFQIVTKEQKIIKLDNGETKCKANFDVEITVDACEHMFQDTCDEIILISGDSDFSYLIAKAKSLNIPIKVISSNATVSSELRTSANNLVLLDDIELNQFLYEKK